MTVDKSFDLGTISIAWLDLKAHEILSSANEAEFSRMLRVVVAEAVARERARHAVEFREVAAQSERFRQLSVAAQQQTQLIAEGKNAEIVRLEVIAEAAQDVADKAKRLTDSMETCHICHCEVLIDGQPVHCMDHSADCDEHEDRACDTPAELHQDLVRALEAYHKATERK